MATTGPFYDTMPGPLRRDTLNEMWGVWQAAIGSPIKGDAGWSPLIRSVQDGDRVVLEVYDWTGGQGTKPTQTGFLGSTGFVATAALAIDIRGPQGLQGIQGVKGDTGLTGDKGDAATISVGTVTTSLPGTTVEVVNSGTTSAAVFDFSIPQGEKGDTGSSGTISVGTTTTVPEGSAASVTNTGTASDAILNFSIPKGDKGDVGTAATIAVGTVTTGAPGTSVVVTNSGTNGAAVFDFTIPRGEDGAGSGDMLKSEYDSVGDGVVNASRSTPWTGITDKPVVIAAGADAASARTAIGLGNVDNTSDESKPVSTAQASALATKQATLVSGSNIKTINGEDLLGSGDIEILGGPTVNDAAPTSPKNGQEWVDGTTGIKFTWVEDGTSGQWVELGPGGEVKSDWAAITGKPAVIAAGEDAAAARAAIGAGTGSGDVTLTGAQTLINKTISAASNTITTEATGNLAATSLNAALAELQTDIDTRAPSSTAATLAGVQTLTNKTLTGYTETVYNLAGTDIAVANGTIQTKTLAANTTFTESLADGQSVILGITAGAFSVTWPTMLWTKVGGSGTMPSLTSSGVNWVVLWKVDSTLRGNFLGTA